MNLTSDISGVGAIKEYSAAMLVEEVGRSSAAIQPWQVLYYRSNLLQKNIHKTCCDAVILGKMYGCFSCLLGYRGINVA